MAKPKAKKATKKPAAKAKKPAKAKAAAKPAVKPKKTAQAKAAKAKAHTKTAAKAAPKPAKPGQKKTPKAPKGPIQQVASWLGERIRKLTNKPETEAAAAPRDPTMPIHETDIVSESSSEKAPPPPPSDSKTDPTSDHE